MHTMCQLQRLETLEETICQTPTADLIEEYRLIKREIENTYHQKANRMHNKILIPQKITSL